MTLSMPETQKSQGYSRLVIIPTVADLDSITVAELTGGDNFTCHLYGDFATTVEESIGAGPRKMCARRVPQQFGNVTHTVEELQYSHLPQESDAAPGNEARAALTPGTSVVAVEFQGLDGEGSVFTAGDRYRAHQVDLGEQRWGRTGDDEFSEFSIRQSLIYSNGTEPVQGVVVA